MSCGVSIRTESGCLWDMLWLDTNVVQVLGRQLLKFCKDVNLNVWSGSGFSPVRLEGDLNSYSWVCMLKNHAETRMARDSILEGCIIILKPLTLNWKCSSTAKPWTISFIVLCNLLKLFSETWFSKGLLRKHIVLLNPRCRSSEKQENEKSS